MGEVSWMGVGEQRKKERADMIREIKERRDDEGTEGEEVRRRSGLTVLISRVEGHLFHLRVGDVLVGGEEQHHFPLLVLDGHDVQ